jgi:ubiquinone biosynthesis protein COQ9
MAEAAIPPLEMTLDELREAIAPLLGSHAAFDGWNERALDMAAAELGVPGPRARLAFRGGAVDMIDAWFDWVDRSMLEAFPPERIAALKIRQRIRDLILFRLNLLRPHREALRRALAMLAMPQNGRATGRLAWRSADRIWRLAGDTATDYNHYTKRTILIGVYASTTLVFLDDETEEMADTRLFLDRRIDDVMQFERVKARLVGRADRRFSVSRFLGRLRYPA